jgi:hypothetical protein
VDAAATVVVAVSASLQAVLIGCWLRLASVTTATQATKLWPGG